MANDDRIALLKKGVAAWNAWREENRNTKTSAGRTRSLGG
jgi:hypothetical protein